MLRVKAWFPEFSCVVTQETNAILDSLKLATGFWIMYFTEKILPL